MNMDDNYYSLPISYRQGIVRLYEDNNAKSKTHTI